jgi:hypothetical protein
MSMALIFMALVLGLALAAAAEMGFRLASYQLGRAKGREIRPGSAPPALSRRSVAAGGLEHAGSASKRRQRLPKDERDRAEWRQPHSEAWLRRLGRRRTRAMRRHGLQAILSKPARSSIATTAALWIEAAAARRRDSSRGAVMISARPRSTGTVLLGVAASPVAGGTAAQSVESPAHVALGPLVFRGGGEDLGGPFEFRPSLGVACEFDDRSRCDSPISRMPDSTGSTSATTKFWRPSPSVLVYRL